VSDLRLDDGPAGQRRLEIGSDVEIATRIAHETTAALGEVVYVEGEFWVFDGQCWRSIDSDLLRRRAATFDGAVFSNSEVRLGKKHRIDSILSELAVILAAAPDFFADAAVGINCRNGFVRLAADGAPELIPHRAAHRRRHVLAGRWLGETDNAPPEASLLAGLRRRCFAGDPDAEDKWNLVAELIGAAAAAYATRLVEAKAIVLLGDSWGKEQVLALLCAMLPPEAVATSPATKDNFVVRLVGKHLNVAPPAAAVIDPDCFEKLIAGDPVVGRDVHKREFRFRAQALHVFAPDRRLEVGHSMRRRLGFLVFNRTIAKDEKIPGLGRRIAAEEPDLLLAAGVAGLQRLMRHKAFTQPAAPRRELQRWFAPDDPVVAWVEAELQRRDPAEHRPGARDRGIPSAAVFDRFEAWAKAAGLSPGLQITGFVQRLRAAAQYVEIIHTARGNRLAGFEIRPRDRDDDAANGGATPL